MSLSLVAVVLCVGVATVMVLVFWSRAADKTARRDGEPAAPTGQDPDDEKVALRDRTSYPSRKWDPRPGTPEAEAAPGPDPDDDVVDEDDRPAANRPRHPANRWETD